MDFFENALFRSYGDICCASLPSLLLNELSMNERDSDGFFSKRLVCGTSDISYNLTGSSLVMANYQLSFVPCSCVQNLSCRSGEHVAL